MADKDSPAYQYLITDFERAILGDLQEGLTPFQIHEKYNTSLHTIDWSIRVLQAHKLWETKK
jgi:hypothetical protein